MNWPHLIDDANYDQISNTHLIVDCQLDDSLKLIVRTID
jgi:hypothetical protein